MSIESMKQALEALEDLYAEQNAAPLWKRREHWENAMIKADVAIPNLRSAIEQMEKAEPVAWGMILPTTGEIYDCISKRHHDEFEGAYTVPLYTTPPYVATPLVQEECVVCGDKVRVIPRPWAGLTDEEYEEAEKAVWAVVSLDDVEKEANREFYQAIEAKLREKNT